MSGLLHLREELLLLSQRALHSLDSRNVGFSLLVSSSLDLHLDVSQSLQLFLQTKHLADD